MQGLTSSWPKTQSLESGQSGQHARSRACQHQITMVTNPFKELVKSFDEHQFYVEFYFNIVTFY